WQRVRRRKGACRFRNWLHPEAARQSEVESVLQRTPPWNSTRRPRILSSCISRRRLLARRRVQKASDAVLLVGCSSSYLQLCLTSWAEQPEDKLREAFRMDPHREISHVHCG